LSHVVTIKTRLTDRTAIAAACQRLNLPQPVHGKAELYAGQTAEGLLVQLPGWKFPIAIDTASGEVKADNFSGYWGNQVEFDRFLQMYAVEATKLQARQKGYAVSETQLQDGSIKLQIQEGT
jgi:hypothetical protein